MKSEKRLESFLGPSLLSEPSRGVGEKEHSESQNDGGSDLDSKRDSELRGVVEELAAILRSKINGSARRKGRESVAR